LEPVSDYGEANKIINIENLDNSVKPPFDPEDHLQNLSSWSIDQKSKEKMNIMNIISSPKNLI